MAQSQCLGQPHDPHVTIILTIIAIYRFYGQLRPKNTKEYEKAFICHGFYLNELVYYLMCVDVADNGGHTGRPREVVLW